MTRGPKPVDFKVCPACGVLKPRSDYYRKLQTISYRCKPCSVANSQSRVHKYKGRYAETQNNWRRKMYSTSPEYRDRVAANKAASYERNKDRLNAERRQRYLADPDYRASTLAHNKRLKDRQPVWVDTNELRAIYKACPLGFEVDHIVPIKGRVDKRQVSGLHVPWNLQYLPASENKRKHCWITESDALNQARISV